MNIGIDKIDYYSPNQYVDLVDLAQRRNIEPDKFTIGIGQEKMALPLLSQDAVTMAAMAADKILNDIDKKDIELLIIGTESGVDESKASALYVRDLLGLPSSVRAFEIKEACYGTTAGLQMAYNFVAQNPEKSALIISSDIARYGLDTPGEVTQGAGSVAMLIKKNPSILKLENDSVFMSENVGDFWRPTYSQYAFARGKYSNEVYIRFFTELYKQYFEKNNNGIEDISALLFHIPYTKMGKKALQAVEELIPADKYADFMKRYESSTILSKNIGNLYTGSLYISLISYLENSDQVEADDKVMLFSYGSGSMGEIFTGKVQPGFKEKLQKKKHLDTLNNRRQLTVDEYETEFKKELEIKDGNYFVGNQTDDKFFLEQIKENERIYKSI
ncbi:hydroxymethylglutaryl-CoA synthase [Companilactobacillus sp. RD055328]|uniref:hydroxymethylglutaryl-CoA synthase n=1 Tax=Companilactobacillus sp. RD055328 TaxID=2916634 RepID=UPI001FC8CC27|nr:hydroxymethylglutaryl-CoA synthase [Companilactobacillus sp. RD055328]GKQ43111.1 hydroxymethylglutaryl-CoA synthase [Companilactobacillus sp. RD055328]